LLNIGKPGPGAGQLRKVAGRIFTYQAEGGEGEKKQFEDVNSTSLFTEAAGAKDYKRKEGEYLLDSHQETAWEGRTNWIFLWWGARKGQGWIGVRKGRSAMVGNMSAMNSKPTSKPRRSSRDDWRQSFLGGEREIYGRKDTEDAEKGPGTGVAEIEKGLHYG